MYVQHTIQQQKSNPNLDPFFLKKTDRKKSIRILRAKLLFKAWWNSLASRKRM
jgi:hypothetical protein